jgi:hypothetical protein
MKEVKAPGAGGHIDSFINELIDEAPAFGTFNGIRLESEVLMQPGKAMWHKYLYDYYHASMTGKPLPERPEMKRAKPQEAPCKQCSRTCTITDKKCWWCEAANPCQ